MFAGFKLELTKSEFMDLNGGEFIKYKKLGEELLKAKKKEIENNIKSFFKEGKINGTKLQDEWFPQIKADIFISHSHVDEELVLSLVGWIYEKFELICFVDSGVWGYADDLLRDINNNYSDKRSKPNGGVLYDYDKCNRAASHVYMMLNIALQRMIDKVEAVILLNTENSLDGDTTHSSWIYSEIVGTEIIRKKTLSQYRKEMLQEVFEKFANKQDFPTFNYDVSTEHLKDIYVDDLKDWYKQWRKKGSDNNYYGYTNYYPLDSLYRIKRLI
ncbi:hypothetical protein [Oceanirhabdus sp. W0125-5]|uniref:hypothetical protein n=1 Tax=Oceanirhabdus sp. W0125-5 TaxID=2999116 RepID=UPI0022F2AE0F|nr:hypothetical protein [Oceanirhabdus sp. W0125-5]WBW98850.1 hypothetical protein OW730_08940 [Oceanirhabdus sp. W0125-5]